jgi:hypothetical protein
VRLADGKERAIQHMMSNDILASERNADVRAPIQGGVVRKATRLL